MAENVRLSDFPFSCSAHSFCLWYFRAIGTMYLTFRLCCSGWICGQAVSHFWYYVCVYFLFCRFRLFLFDRFRLFFFCFPFSKLSFDQTYQYCNFVLYVDDRMSHGYGLGLPCSYRPAAHCFLAKYYWCGRYASTTTGRPSAEALALAFLDSNS